MKDFVILVDSKDREIGIEEKLKAHQMGKLHRAFSIFIFNKHGQMLLQRRALKKYHSGGLWSNACCSHPKKGEELEEAAHRRLKEEMGFDCPLKRVFSFIYKAKLDKQLTEHEFDHVFVGRWNGRPKPNAKEVCQWKWADINQIRADMRANPENYTAWFKIVFDKVCKFQRI
jgi:isopentenyl-diphosphate delta-isomerase